MRYKTFGRRTGLRVSELALGAGNFGTRWGHGAERDEAKEVFDSYVEAGGNFIDTAGSYQFGESEELVGDFIAADRDSFVLATKYTLGTTATDGISRTPEQLAGTLGALDLTLSPNQIARLDEASAIPLGTPHEQIHSSAAAIAGGKPELLVPRSVPVA